MLISSAKPPAALRAKAGKGNYAPRPESTAPREAIARPALIFFHRSRRTIQREMNNDPLDSESRGEKRTDKHRPNIGHKKKSPPRSRPCKSRVRAGGFSAAVRVKRCAKKKGGRASRERTIKVRKRRHLRPARFSTARRQPAKEPNAARATYQSRPRCQAALSGAGFSSFFNMSRQVSFGPNINLRFAGSAASARTEARAASAA